MCGPLREGARPRACEGRRIVYARRRDVGAGDEQRDDPGEGLSGASTIIASGVECDLELASAGTVLAVSDLGSPILANTSHRVLAGPYHRNMVGNLAMINAFLGSAADAESIARDASVDYLALCRGNAENRNFSVREPAGLMADLIAGRVPPWMALDPETRGATIEVYRIVSVGNK